MKNSSTGPGIVMRAWRLLTWKHWAWATGLGVLVSASVPFEYFDVDSYWALRRVFFHAPWFILFSYVFLAAIAIAEASADESNPSLRRYLAAILAASVTCVGAAWYLAYFVQTPPVRVGEGKVRPLPRQIDRDRNVRSYAASMALDAAFHGALATLIYARLRSSRRVVRALARAELERSEAGRNLLESRFDAAHAEVDPARVIERLEAIERGYAVDPAMADAQLDELIFFLRGAIPRMRSDVQPIGGAGVAPARHAQSRHLVVSLRRESPPAAM